MALSYGDVVAALEDEFFLARIKMELNQVEDIETVRDICLKVIEVMQRQREMFIELLDGGSIDDEGDLTGFLK